MRETFHKPQWNHSQTNAMRAIVCLSARDRTCLTAYTSTSSIFCSANFWSSSTLSRNSNYQYAELYLGLNMVPELEWIVFLRFEGIFPDILRLFFVDTMNVVGSHSVYICIHSLQCRCYVFRCSQCSLFCFKSRPHRLWCYSALWYSSRKQLAIRREKL